MTNERNRKERVLHTRVPAFLDEELKVAADRLRMPVSNLVRTILEDAVTVRDRATERVGRGLEKMARSVHEEGGRFAEQLEDGLNKAARTVRHERTRVADLLEEELFRAVRSVDEGTGRAADRLEKTLRKVAQTLGTQSHALGERFEQELYEAVDRLRAESAAASRTQSPNAPAADVYAYQSVIMAISAECAQCGVKIESGKPAGLGLTSDPERRVFVCERCIPRVK